MKLKQLVAVICVLPFASFAETGQNTAPTTENIIHFNTEIQREVTRDLTRVVLFAQEENADLKKLGTSINKKLEQAITQIQAQSAVEIQDNFRTTQVRYDNQGKQTGWIDRATLVLQSKDSVALSNVIAELNGVFAIESVSSSVSPKMIETVEDEMIKEALKQFEHKADVIKTGLNAKGYQIVELVLVNPPEHAGNDVFLAEATYANEKMAFSSYEKNTQPLPATKTTLKASVNAKIKLIKD